MAAHGMKVRKRRAQREARLTPCACGYLHNAARCPVCQSERVGKAPRKPPTPYEDRHQAALFQWIELAKAAHPDLAKLYHVPNGGARNALEGARLKAQGVQAGRLDLNLDVARGGYFGLRIELKATKAELGRTPEVSPDQQRILAELRADGYAAHVAEGWEDARDLLLAYLSAPPTVPAACPAWQSLQKVVMP